MRPTTPEPVRSFSTRVDLRETEECHRILRGFSDVELLKFHKIGGTVPRDMLGRLRDVCAREAEILELEMRQAATWRTAPRYEHREAVVPWVEPPGSVRKRIVAAAESRTRRITKARATLVLLGAA